MACGHAPIVSDRAPLRDYLSPQTSRVVAPDDVAALRAAIQTAAADHDATVAMGAAARARVEGEFTTRAFARRLADVLREVA